MAEPKWETYRSFLAVMTEGSLSAAARKLSLTQPTLGRHVGQFEADLGLPLFLRSQTGLIPTQAARELLPHAQAMASAAEALVAKKLGRIGFGLFAHRRYLEKHGTPKSLDDMRGHAIIGFDKETPFIQALRKAGLPLSREMFALRTDADLAQLAALRAGFGIGVTQLGIGRREPDLVPLLPGALKFELEMWLAMHGDLRGTRRMRLLFDCLAENLAAYAATSRAG
ncbi:MAG: LysR family transcriptional regulator [Rhizomicrobium sp.]